MKQLLATHAPDVEELSACFGKKNSKRAAEITEILTMLQSLGGM